MQKKSQKPEKPEEPTKEEIDKIENRTYPTLPITEEIIIERSEPKSIKKETEEMYSPLIPDPYPSHVPKENPEEERRNSNILHYFAIIGIIVLLGGFLIFVWGFINKEFSVNIENNPPDVNITPINTNNYNHTIVNNNTIIIDWDKDVLEDLTKLIINEVKKQLNITNSS